MRIKKDFAPVTITIDSENELKNLREILCEFQRLRDSEYRWSFRQCLKTEYDLFVEYLLKAIQ